MWIKITKVKSRYQSHSVTSFTLVWIKITKMEELKKIIEVTSFTLVWIKMAILACWAQIKTSRASRSCGLKLSCGA